LVDKLIFFCEDLTVVSLNVTRAAGNFDIVAHLRGAS
jgi:hypothetical protein